MCGIGGCTLNWLYLERISRRGTPPLLRQAAAGIGVAPMQQGITAGQWCRNADTAMYQAKRARTAVWAYHTDLKPCQQASGADNPRPVRASSRH